MGDRSNYRGGGRGPHHSGGPHRGGARQPDQQQYQLSYVGHKRDRDERDPYLELVERLMRLCDRNNGAVDDVESLESEMKSAVAVCKSALNHRMDAQLRSLLLECVLQLSTKTPVYAVLIGLLNDEAPEFILSLVETLNDTFNSALAVGDCDRARLLLRLFCSLVLSNVLHASGVVALLEALVETAMTVAKNGSAAGGVAATGITWQPWTDYLVGIVALALPWGGSELPESAPAEVGRIVDGMAAYVAARPIAADLDLRPFDGDLGPDDEAAKSDSGGASFLSTLVAALQDCQTSNRWQIAAIPAVHTVFHTRLAGARACELPHIQIPQSPPNVNPHSSPAQISAQLRGAFGPRGSIRLLNRQHTEADRPIIERFVAEEYLHDVIAQWDGDKVECVRRLGAGLPIPWPYVNLLAEFLFGQLLTLPAPRLPTPAYDLLLIELCKLPADRFPFTKALSACVRELFGRIKHLDPELRGRLASWLSSHLSHFGFHWPWERWQAVLTAPPSDAQRQFCADVIERLVRLAYWDKIQATLPDGFRELMGPCPALPLLPGQAPPQLPPALPGSDGTEDTATPLDQPPTDVGGTGTADDVAMVDSSVPAAAQDTATASHGASVSAAAPAAADMQEDVTRPDGDSTAAMETSAAPAAAAAAVSAPEPELVLAGELLSALRTSGAPVAGGAPAPATWLTGRQLLEWLTDNGPPEWAEQPMGALRVVMRALLAVGAKSPTHLHAAFQRYEEPLRALLAGCGQEGRLALLSLAAEFYASVPQKVLMVADRLMALHLVGGDAVVMWAFGSEGIRQPSDVRLNRVVWDIVHFAVDRTMQLPQQGEEEARAKAEEVQACKDKARSFADRSVAAADARQQRAVLEASAQEEKLLEAAAALQAELDHQLSALKILREEPNKVMLQAFRSFATFVAVQEQSAGASAPPTTDVEASTSTNSTDPEDSLREAYARLRAFSRRYRMAALPVVEILKDEVFAPDVVSDKVMSIMTSVFHWSI